MASTDAKNSPSPPSSSSGAFEFFRKYQKPVLFTAGIFALITFSITGAVTGFFTAGPASFYRAPRLTLPDGRDVEVTFDDWNVGFALMQAARQPVPVLPDLATDQEREGLRERYAALRRLAIEFGIEASDAEVDRAIAQALKMYAESPFAEHLKTPTQLATSFGYTSLAQYRSVLYEAMRVGTFLRLQLLGIDISDATVAEQVLSGQEMLTLKVAAVDKKQLAEQLKAQGIADEELNKWLHALPEAEQVRYQDENHVALHAVGLRYDEFDPSQFAAELKGKELSDEQLKQEYGQRKERCFRKPDPPAPPPAAPQDQEEGKEAGKEAGKEEGQETGKAGGDGKNGAAAVAPAAAATAAPPAPGDPTAAPDPAKQDPDAKPQGAAPPAPETGTPQAAESQYRTFEEVKEELRRMLQAEAALDALRNGAAQDRIAEHMREAIAARDDATLATAEARQAAAKAQAEADAAPQDAEKAQAAAAATAALAAVEQEQKTAEAALDARRQAFDFAAVMSELLAKRSGARDHSIVAPVGRTGLRELGELGTWDDPWVATSMTADGDISTQVQKTKVACFHFQVPKIVLRPLKPFTEIAEAARADYFAKQADEQAVAAKKKFEDKLLELAKAQLQDEVAKIEKEHAELLDRRLLEWEQGLQAQLAEAEEQLARVPARSEGHRQWDVKRREVQDQLAAKDAKRGEMEKAIAGEREQAVTAAARKAYKDVLDAAVVDSGFEIRTLGPYSTKLSSQPRFRDRYGEDVRFLFGDPTASAAVLALKVGEATELFDDQTGRALYLAVAVNREPATLAAVARRELLQAREQVTQERLAKALQQSFTVDALKARYNYQTSVEGEDQAPSAVPGAPPDSPGK